MIAYNSCGADTLCRSITIEGCDPPVADFTTAVDQNNIILTYIGTLPVDSVAWNLGDGNTGQGDPFSYTYSAPGDYTICLTAYNSCGEHAT